MLPCIELQLVSTNCNRKDRIFFRFILTKMLALIAEYLFATFKNRPQAGKPVKHTKMGVC